MIFKINYNGEYEDSLIVSGESIDEIREKVLVEIKLRGWNENNCWSEELTKQ